MTQFLDLLLGNMNKALKDDCMLGNYSTKSNVQIVLKLLCLI